MYGSVRAAIEVSNNFAVPPPPYGGDPNGDMRTMLNVGHGLEATYATRFQRALDAVLAIAEPHDTVGHGRPTGEAVGSPYGRGFTDGQRSLAGAVIAAMRTALFPDGPEE